MADFLFDLDSLVIMLALLGAIVLAIEGGSRLGRRSHGTADEAERSHVRAVEASVIGLLALVIGFSFSLALQRFDNRTGALLGEANAIGTTWLRSGLLSSAVREDTRALLDAYAAQRACAGRVSLDEHAQRDALAERERALQAGLWQCAVAAVSVDPDELRSGLFVESLNDMIDAYGARQAVLRNHVPVVVTLLLFATIVLSGGIVGYAAGVSGHRPVAVTYLMVLLIVVLVYLIIDLDRPRRGLIEVDQGAMLELSEAISTARMGDSAPTGDPAPGAAAQCRLAAASAAPHAGCVAPALAPESR